jgi:hypothetical protein
VIFGVFVSFAAVLFAGCLDVLSPPKTAPGGDTVLVVQIAGESPVGRTALPSEAPAAAKYNISVTRSGISLGIGNDLTGSPFAIPLSGVPAAGDVVKVEGFNSSNAKVAEGESILSDGQTSVSITLYPSRTGTGNVALAVSIPASFTGSDAITAAEVSLYRSLADYQTGTVYSSTRYRKDGGYGEGTDRGENLGNSVPISHTGLPSGNYVVQIDFFRFKFVRVSRLVQTIIVRDSLTTNKWDNGSSTLDWGTDKFASSNANLANSNGIKIAGTTVTGYSPTTYAYSITKAWAAETPALTFARGAPGQKIEAKLNGDSVTSGENLTLNQNSVNSLIIAVTAPDGVTQQTYTVSYTYRYGTEWYVDADGDDSNAGTSSAEALATIGKALEKISDEYDSGSTWPGGSTNPLAARINISGTILATNPVDAANITDTNLYTTYPPIILAGSDTAKIEGAVVRPLQINKAAVILEDDLTLTRNSTVAVGGVLVGGGGSFTMNGGKITGNEIHGSGGGVYVTGAGSSFTMNGGEITGNKALGNSDSSGGGGVAVADGAAFTLNGGTISDNKTHITEGVGGGVLVAGGGSFTMNGGTITGNEASAANGGNGVGVIEDGSFTMHGGSISGNVTGQHGGGVFIRGGTFTLVNGTISGNAADDADLSGGVFVLDGAFSMSGGSVSGNTGRAVRVIQTGSFTMSGGPITGNTGGGVRYEGGSFIMKGGACITQDNEVWLGNGKTISVASDLTGTPYAARITPSVYEPRQVLTGSNFASSISKFTVTPESDGTNWTIDAGGNLQRED